MSSDPTKATNEWSLGLSDSDTEDNNVETDNANFANLFDKPETLDGETESLNNEIQELLKDVEKSIEYGPELIPAVADGFNKTMERPLSKETNENLRKQFQIPSNCKSFAIPKMNHEIWSQLPTTARLTDLSIQQTQQSLGTGLNALAQIANITAVNASKIPKDVKSAILKMTIDSGNVLADQIQSFSRKRRLEVKRHINVEYHGICTAQIPPSEFLFGADLNETLKASKTSSNVIRKSFSRGERQRHQPYSTRPLNFQRPGSFNPPKQPFGHNQRGSYPMRKSNYRKNTNWQYRK